MATSTKRSAVVKQAIARPEGVSGENGAGGDAGLVLGGGGARGAYASGALSVLLPELKDQVRVIVGTSAGALIAAYLVANWHRPVEDAIEDGLRFWRELQFGDVCSPLMAPAGVARFARYVGEFLPVSTTHARSILHPEPLKQTLDRLVDFDRLGENIRERRRGSTILRSRMPCRSAVPRSRPTSTTCFASFTFPTGLGPSRPRCAPG